MSSGNIGGEAKGDARLHAACEARIAALENALIKAGADEQAKVFRIAALEAALREARAYVTGTDKARSTNFVERIDAVLKP